MIILIIRAVNLIFEIINYAILGRVLLSWIPIPRDNPLIRLLYQITEPILGPIRELVQRSPIGKNMMIDFSPIIAFILLEVIRNVIVRLLV